MSSIIRQSSNIAQLSRYSIRCTARPAFRLPSHPFLRASKILIRQTRSHASQSKNSEQPNKKNRPKDGAGVDKKASTPPSSNASTEEQNFINERNAYSKNMEREEISGDAPLVKGMVKLSADEEEQIAHLLRISKDGLPDSQHKKLEEAFELIKREGISPELRAAIQRIQAKPYSLSTALRLTKLLYQVAERMVNEEKKNGSQQNTKNNSSSPPGFESNQNPRRNDGPKQEPRPLEWKGNDLTSTILISFVSYLIYSFLVPGESSRNITYQEFQSTFLDNGLVEKLTVINENRVRVDLHREATQKMFPDSPAVNPNFHYYFSIGSVESFERKLDKAQDDLGIPAADRIPVNYSKQHDLLGLIINFAPTLLFIGSIVWFSKRAGSGGAGGGVFGMGKTRAKRFNHETAVKVKFADVAGMDEAKLEIMEFVSFLKTPEQFQRLGAKIPRGAILSGPPGTGKTLLAKATAGESEVPFFSVSGSEFMEMFVGVGASRVRDLFALARKNTPCIIFIDEIDAIGKSRKSGSFGGGNDEREATLNQILTEMDGFNTTDQIVVLAGTNRADVLDKALMRPGRFDRHIAIDRPTMDGRKQIFLVHLKKIVTFEDLEYLTGRLSALTPGFSGADIANCCNEAALIAARTSAKSVKMMHFEQAIERVVGGLEKKSLVLSPEEKKVVAYHEAGHAICGWYFKYADPLLKVSIIPRGQGALGYAQYLPNSDSYLMNVKQLMDRMAMTLGGRISEELHFETVTSGASDDFDKVTRLARAMVTQWGMSPKLGLLHFQDNSEQSFQKPFAEATAQLIDSEVRRIVDQAYQQCKTLLTEKKKEIGIIAEELLAKEVLDRNDMVRLLGKRPFDDNKEFEKYFGGGAKSAPPPFPTENTDNPTCTTPL